MPAALKNIPFELLIFHRDVAMSCQLLQAGASAILIDFEHCGKEQRQKGFNTEINAQSVDDLRRLRAETDQAIMCRISGPDATEHEILSVIENGTDEIIIPMVDTPAEVDRIIAFTKDKCRVTVMIETKDGVLNAKSLAAMPINRIYVGLNDLHIQRGTKSIFAPLADGLLGEIRQNCSNVKFGFGGLTLPDCGTPVPAKHLYAEMARLNCCFTFLRRSFYRDIIGKDIGKELAGIQAAMQDMQSRTPDQVSKDHLETVQAVTQSHEFDHA